MSLRASEDEIRTRMRPLLDEPALRRGIDVVASDPFFLAHFLVSVSQGEGLGEAAVGIIGQEEIARRIRDLERQEAEERGHKERTLDAARRLFPECFDEGGYRFPKSLQGQPYYVAVLEANRERLARLGRYSRLNQYLTTTFGYEVMVVLLYRAVAAAVAASPLPADLRAEVSSLLEGILDEEETHLGILDQHDALLALGRADLSPEARAALDDLGRLREEDYAFAAELSMRQLLVMMGHYAEPAAYRSAIEATEGS